MKIKEKLELTVSRGLYNKLYKLYLARIGKIDCNYCGYHVSQNTIHKQQKSWKEKRKTQYLDR